MYFISQVLMVCFSFRFPMSNHSAVATGDLACPLLQLMIDHSLNNNTKANIVLVCIHGMVSCLGILENALIIWVVGFRLQRRTVASVWVLNLALSDFLATLTLPLFTLYLSSNHSWELGGPLCKIQTSIFFLNMFVSAFLLAAISLDRCLLVAKPVWSQNHRSVIGAWKVCAFGWLLAVINTFPYFLFRSVTEKKDHRKLCYHNFAMYLRSPDMLERECRIRQEATAISKVLLAFLIPLMVIAGSYIQIAFTLRKRRLRRRESASRLANTLIHQSNDATTQATPTTTNIFLKLIGRSPSLTPITPSPTVLPTQNQLSQSFTKMVTFVITVFVLCWAPYHIFCIIEVVAEYRSEYSDLVQVALPLATTFAFLNPVLNPILYAFSCPHFCVRIRQSLVAVFEGLVEEGGGILLVPGKSIRAHIKRNNSSDGTKLHSPRYQPSPSTDNNQSPFKSKIYTEQKIEEEKILQS